MRRSTRIWSARALPALLALAGLATAVPPAAAGPVSPGPASAAWSPSASAAETSAGATRVIRPERFTRWQLDRGQLEGSLTSARRSAAGAATITLPSPDGGLARFAVAPSVVMEAGLAAAHPDITTWAGRGIDDPAASVRLDLGPLGLHASVRGAQGSWYVDPYYTRDRGLYLSYYARDLRQRPGGTFVETEGDGLAAAKAALGEQAPALSAAAGAAAPVGSVLRTYRLALVSDPSYAQFFGTENVTAAKVALINRVDQIYEDDLSIRLVLVDGTDKLNLDTAAKATGANGPCGPEACFRPNDLSSCTISALLRNRFVLGRLLGASAFDVGHIALGNAGGGIAGLGVVGGFDKAVGCTGLPQPVGDFYAVDYVAHELGHQFGGNHTFNGVIGACSGGNRNPATSVEPGSGSSIMAYAGICGRDDLQPHSDPYFSQRSQLEIDRYTRSSQGVLDEVQTVGLRGFDGTDSFALAFRGATTGRLVRGSNYSANGIEAALRALPTFPAGGDVAVTRFGSPEGPVDSTGFQIAFRGALGGVDLPNLRIVDPRGVTGSVGETHQGGPVDNAGAVTRTGNTPPVVRTPQQFTIPLRTPFALSGDGTDADGDVLTYLWEQNDPAASGTGLLDPQKTAGPLFRQFGTPLDAAIYEPGVFGSPGENAATTDPRRTFPDLSQVLRGNTNALTGDCEGPRGNQPNTAPALLRNCYSEFLPTADYQPSALHFRLTARDNRPGGGGVSSADTTLVLAKQAGPFLVTAPAGGAAYRAGSQQFVRWDVAGTDAAPVGVSRVRITLSTDGGRTFGFVLAESTPNDGSQLVTLPSGTTGSARIRVEAIGNVFFAVNGGAFSIG